MRSESQGAGHIKIIGNGIQAEGTTNGKTPWLGLLKRQKEDQAAAVEWIRRVVREKKKSEPQLVHTQLYMEHRFQVIGSY